MSALPMRPDPLSPNERDLMEHATAWKHPANRLFRNRFVTGPDSSDWPILVGLVSRGLMDVSAPSDLHGGMSCFWVTKTGMEALEWCP